MELSNLIQNYEIDRLDILHLDPLRTYDVLVLTALYNEEAFVERFLKHSEEIADGLVLLDDGSSDNTYAKLSGDKVLAKFHRKREHPLDFDDAKLRNFFIHLVYSGFLRCRWVMWLDADELLRASSEQIHALRRFLKSEEHDINVVSFPLVHVVSDDKSYWKNYPRSDGGVSWKARMFRHRHGQVLRQFTQKLHFNLIPFNYKAEEAARSDILIKHYGNFRLERRLERYKRYAYNDPQLSYQQAGYGHLRWDAERIQLGGIADITLERTY